MGQKYDERGGDFGIRLYVKNKKIKKLKIKKYGTDKFEFTNEQISFTKL